MKEDEKINVEKAERITGMILSWIFISFTAIICGSMTLASAVWVFRTMLDVLP